MSLPGGGIGASTQEQCAFGTLEQLALSTACGCTFHLAGTAFRTPTIKISLTAAASAPTQALGCSDAPATLAGGPSCQKDMLKVKARVTTSGAILTNIITAAVARCMLFWRHVQWQSQKQKGIKYTPECRRHSETRTHTHAYTLRVPSSCFRVEQWPR
eukprot:1160644-Pelagomonas_calceolata.AAC.3